MALTPDGNAPYTAAATLVNLIKRFRDKGLAFPVTVDVLLRAGVPESLSQRTLQALQLLELIDEAGNATETLKKIREAPEKEYKATLAAWLKRVYAEVFKFADPSSEDETEVRDAFRTFIPHAQQDRMVKLFMALCAEAGLAPESKKAEAKARVRPVVQAGQGTRLIKMKKPPAPPAETFRAGGVPAPIGGLLSTLPKAWTKQDRDKFLMAFTAMLDYSIPVRTAAELDAEKEAE